MFANEWCGAVYLNHGESPAGGRDGGAFPCISLLPNPQCVQFRLESAPVDDLRRPGFIIDVAFHRSAPGGNFFFRFFHCFTFFISLRFFPGLPILSCYAAFSALAMKLRKLLLI